MRCGLVWEVEKGSRGSLFISLFQQDTTFLFSSFVGDENNFFFFFSFLFYSLEAVWVKFEVLVGMICVCVCDVKREMLLLKGWGGIQ